MSTSTMTKEERQQLTNARQSAVRNAWKEEAVRVANGQGTRDWSPEEQKELLSSKTVSGYEGHHMKSVSLSPEQAGNPENIQFLSEEEHLEGAHQGSYHNATNGYYDPQTSRMHEFNGDELRPAPVRTLTEQYHPEQESATGEEFDYAGGPFMEGQVPTDKEFDYAGGPFMDGQSPTSEEFDYAGGPFMDGQSSAQTADYTEGVEFSGTAEQSGVSADASQENSSGQGYE